MPSLQLIRDTVYCTCEMAEGDGRLGVVNSTCSLFVTTVTYCKTYRSWDTGFSTFFAPPLAGSIVSRTIKGFCSGKRGKFEMALLAPGVDSWFQGNQSGCRRQMCLYCCISRQPNPPRGDDEDRHATVPSADITWTWKYAVPWPYTRSLVNH
jgi:hypothetical protein